MSSNKVKGIFKGIRYISQIFENEKEQEIQIGFPTDVKHVAHIGWDGPSVNSPSWMNEFKTAPGFASAPLSVTGDAQSNRQDNAVKWISEDSRRTSTRNRDLRKGSRRQTTSSNNSSTDSPTRERSRQSRKTSNKTSNLKDSSDGSSQAQQLDMSSETLQGNGSPAQNLSDNPKRTRRKKSKENTSGGGVSSKLRSKAHLLDPTMDIESPTKSGR